MKISFLRLAAPWFLVILRALLSRAIFALVPALLLFQRLLMLAISLLLLVTMRTRLSQLSTVLLALLSLAMLPLLRTSLTWLKSVIALLSALLAIPLRWLACLSCLCLYVRRCSLTTSLSSASTPQLMMLVRK